MINDFSRNEDWRHQQGLTGLQKGFATAHDALAKILYHAGRFSVAALALRPIHGRASIRSPGIYPLTELRPLLLLPYPNSHCPLLSGSNRRFRLQLTELFFFGDGYPRFVTDRNGLSVDIAQYPRQVSYLFERATFDPTSVGGEIEGHVRELTAPIDGELALVVGELWADVAIKTRKRGRERLVVVYRFPLDTFADVCAPLSGESSLLVAEGEAVAAGEPILRLVGACQYGVAVLSRDGLSNVLRRQRRDVLSVSSRRRRGADFVLSIANRLLAQMADAAESETVAREEAFPRLLGHFNRPLRELTLLPGFQITPAAQAHIIDGLSFGGSWKLYLRANLPVGQEFHVEALLEQEDCEFDLLKMREGATIDVPKSARVHPEVLAGRPLQNGDPFADPVLRTSFLDFEDVISAARGNVGMIFDAFLRQTAVLPQNSSSRIGSGFLLDARFCNADMLSAVKNWFVDLREAGPHLHSFSGAYVPPPFPRPDVFEFTFDVNGVYYDATPHPAVFAFPQGSQQRREEPVLAG